MFRSNLLLFVSIFLILYVTLFPFDFVPTECVTWECILESFDNHFDKSYLLRDFSGNILLFLPLGFALAGKLSTLGLGETTLSAVVLFVGLLLSTLVEILQAHLLRVSSFFDMIANVLGAITGAIIFSYWGNLISNKAKQVWEKRLQRISTSNLLIILILYPALLLSSWNLHNKASDLNSWDPSFSMILGNERTGDRPWRGEISEVYLASQALSAEEITTIYTSGNISGSAFDKSLAHYRLTSGENFNDQIGNLPDLNWHNNIPGRYDNHGIHVDPLNWLETQAPVNYFIDQVRSSSQFTVGVIFASFDPLQSGPARIFSISSDPYHRNLTLAQEGNDLVFRFRHPFTDENGRKPEFILSNIITGGDFHHLIATFNVDTLRLYLDGRPKPYIFQFTPDLLLFWFFPPSKVEQIRLNAFNPLIFRSLFYVIAFLPPSFLLTLILGRVRGKAGPKKPFVYHNRTP